MDEVQRIIERYERREKSNIDHIQAEYGLYRNYIRKEREAVYERIVNRHIKDTSKATIMEIGAGDGSNLVFFKSIGFRPEHVFANELIPAKVSRLRELLPGSVVHEGNAVDLPYTATFDICFQSTVFTSVLDRAMKADLARKMVQMVKPGGFVLWYDFVFNNPSNKDVKGVGKKEIRSLFPGSDIEFIRVTLLPPLGRRVGKLYGYINGFFPFLRSHLIAVIKIN